MIKIIHLVFLLMCAVLIQIILDYFVITNTIDNNVNVPPSTHHLPHQPLQPLQQNQQNQRYQQPQQYQEELPIKINKQRFKYAPRDTVRQIYKMLYIIDKIFTDYQIEYWMSGGTFLGAIRHNGIIPWDDDGDVEIFESNEQKVANLGPILAKYNLVIVPTWFGFKIFSKNGKHISGYKWLYPSIDIFVMKENPAKTINPTIIFKYKKAQKTFGHCGFNQNLMYPLKRYKFGSFELTGVNERNIVPYFDNCYGNDWMDYAYEQYDHENEKTKKKIKLRLTKKEKNPALPLDPIESYVLGADTSRLPILTKEISQTDYIY